MEYSEIKSEKDIINKIKIMQEFCLPFRALAILNINGGFKLHLGRLVGLFFCGARKSTNNPTPKHIRDILVGAYVCEYVGQVCGVWV